MGYTKNFYTEDEVEIVPITSSKMANLTGKKYNRLSVLGFAGSHNNSKYWWCKCECGTIKKMTTGGLAGPNTKTKSCGCLNLKNIISHGMSRTPEYRAYTDAKTRCTKINAPNYHRYGGRGIEFKFDTFEDFYAEIGDKPTSRHTLDRIDNEKHYEIGNIRWANIEEQSSNKEITVMLKFAGEDLTIGQWCKKLNITDYSYIKNRIHNLKWCPICSLNMPKGRVKPPVNCGHEKDYKLYKKYKS